MQQRDLPRIAASSLDEREGVTFLALSCTWRWFAACGVWEHGVTEERPSLIDALRVIEFAEPGPMRDRLVDLVLSGDKRASAGLLSDWESAQLL